MRAVLTLLAIAGTVGLAVLTNPSPQDHRARIKQGTAERSPLAGALGVGALSAFASEYHSVGVASYTVVGEETVTVGAFGVVVMVD